MKQLSTADRCRVVSALVEGCSVRSTVRMTGVAKNTVIKLLRDMGKACSEFQDRIFRNLPCKRLQLDEIWSFVYAKAKNVPADRQGEFGVGDVWTWTAIDADSKLVPSWMIGPRDGETATAFVRDLSERMAGRVQITTDGLKAYVEAVEDAFGCEVDYAQLMKQYGSDPSGEKRYSPAKIVGVQSATMMGRPDPEHVSTSYVERQNLTMRMRMRRFTRLTNAFSKKVENHAHAIALYFMHYNFVRIHQTIRSTPAMRAGVTDHKWSIEEMIDLLPPLKYNTRPKKVKLD